MDHVGIDVHKKIGWRNRDAAPIKALRKLRAAGMRTSWVS
jgi:hypothetical protein